MIESLFVKDLIERVSPSLVEIFVTEDSRPERVGTGFAISSEGRIATCMHVLGSKTEGLFVQLQNENTGHPAKIVAQDTNHDLAILAIKPSLRPLPLGDFAQVDVGKDVMWGGFPLEVWVPSFHKGMISFKGELPLPFTTTPSECLQLDGTSNKGISGGPVIDPHDGRVVAIITSTMGAVDAELASLLQRKEGGSVRLMGVDPIVALKKIVVDMTRHLQLGVAYGISVQYLSSLAANL